MIEHAISKRPGIDGHYSRHHCMHIDYVIGAVSTASFQLVRDHLHFNTARSAGNHDMALAQYEKQGSGPRVHELRAEEEKSEHMDAVGSNCQATRIFRV